MKSHLLLQPSVRRRAVAFTALLLMLGSIAAWWRACESVGQQRTNTVRLQSQLRDTERSIALPSDAQTGTPWPEALPGVVSAPHVLGQIRAAADERAVVVLSISVSSQAPSVATQGRLLVDLDLRGTYAALKEAISEVLSREPGHVLVQAMSYRRRVGARDLDSHVQLVWLTRPLSQK